MTDTSTQTNGRRNTLALIIQILNIRQTTEQLLLLLLLKKVGVYRLIESDVHTISPKTPAQQYQPIDRNKRKGKTVGDYCRDRAA